MFQLKRLTPDGVPAAVKRAAHYRLLGDPWAAESICRDVLEVDPENQEALVTLLLALSDQFGSEEDSAQVSTVQDLLPRLASEYQRAYYAGLLCERWAKRLFRRQVPGAGPMVYDWLRRAMNHYEKAEQIRPPGDDDPILRWNTCARLIERHEEVVPASPAERVAVELE
jgi:hypothetical protein